MCFFSWKKSDLYDRRTGSCVVLPCGRCIGCRLDSLAIWSVRASYEMVKYRNAFVTFTYDTLHLPYNVGSLVPTLRKDDFHKFLNSFRHNIRNNYTNCMPYLCTPDYKYYCVGEYGDSLITALLSINVFSTPLYSVCILLICFSLIINSP